MKRIAIFGKPGSGKSTLAKRLSKQADIPYYPLDSVEYNQSGHKVSTEQFHCQHQAILQQHSWLVDGFGPINAFYERLEQADVLIYVDLPYPVSYWLVTNRLLTSFFKRPEGWPEHSSVFKGTVQSYKTLRLCPRFWNANFEKRLTALSSEKTIYIIKSISALKQFQLNQEVTRLS